MSTSVESSAELARARRAVLKARRVELTNPARAILEACGSMLANAAGHHSEFEADIRTIETAATNLLMLADDLLSPEGVESLQSEADFRRVRHDLLNRLNPVLNYTEMWLEEAQEQFLEGFIEDLELIRTAGKRCCDLVDRILEVSSPETAHADFINSIAELFRPATAVSVTKDQSGGHILVVDDDATNGDLLRRKLRPGGHQVSVATSATEALELLAAETFDVILLDVVMPDTDGVALLRIIKQDIALREIPVIMMSALTDDELVAHCINLGAEDYLTKPYKTAFLEARIGNCLEKRRLQRREKQIQRELEHERQLADDLLNLILPAQVVSELKLTNGVSPRRFSDVAVLFADIVNFTPYCECHTAEDVVQHLQQLVGDWECIAAEHQVSKIKTIGDAFMAASGLLEPVENPVVSCIRCGLEMLAATRRCECTWDLRIGIHVGPVVAGIIGRKQFLYDLWGDTVNTAARMESHGVPGKINLSEAAWLRIAELANASSRGIINVKGKASMSMYVFDGFLGHVVQPALATAEPIN